MTTEPDAYAYDRAVIARNLEDMSPNNRALVRTWLIDHARRGRRPSTLRGYAVDLARLDRFLSARPILDLGPGDARAFLDSLASNGQTSVLHAATRIKCFLRDHHEAELPLALRRALRVNCTAGLRAQKPVESHEFEALLTGCDSLQDQAMLGVLWDSAWRAAEVACMRIGSVEWDQYGCARIETPDNTPKLKRGKALAYLSDPRALGLLRAWMDAHPRTGDPDAPLWPSPKTAQPIRGWAVYQRLQRIRKNAGLGRRVTPHSFRHGWVTRALRKGLDANLIKKQTNWTDLRQMKVYEHLERQDLEREMRRLQGLDDEGRPLSRASAPIDPELLSLLRALKRGMDNV